MIVKQNLSILFYQKTKKVNKKGEILLYARVTIDGIQDEFSTGIRLLHHQWNPEARQADSCAPEHKVLNKKLGQIKADSSAILTWFRQKKGSPRPRP